MALDDHHLTSLATLKEWLTPKPSGSIVSVVVVDGGEDYTSAPTVTVSDPTGSDAVVTAEVVDGVVVAFEIESPGNGYTSPSVSLTGAGGSGATATAAIDDDAALAKLIVDASSSILRAAAVEHFYDDESDIVERRNGNGRDRMMTRQKPITGVSSLTIDGAVTPASDGRSRGFLFDATTIYLIGTSFAPGVQNVIVTYTAGEAEGSPEAQAAERACIATCVLWWKRRAYAHLQSESAPQGMGTSISIQTAAFPPEVKEFIESLQRSRAVWAFD